MEVVYFVISIIEVILTAYLVFIINRTTRACEFKLQNFEEKFNIFLPEFRKIADLLNKTARLSKMFSAFKKKTKHLRKLIKSIKAIQAALVAVDIIKGKKKHKFKIFPIIKKLFFCI